MEVDEPPLQLKPALSLVPERIKIIKSLGRGGFSVVYLALLQKPGGEARHVALKLCQPQGANADPRIKHQVVQLFLREAALTQSLNHKHIICCYGTMELPAGFPGVMGLTGPVYGMALDLCEPTSAKHLIMRAYTQGRHRAYSTDQALEWLAQVASALAHLHTHEPVVIHRDIKQENILFKKVAGGRLEAVLADLGLHVTLEAERGAMLRRRLPSGSGPGTITEGLCEGCDDSEPGQPPPWGATGGGTPFASPFLSLASGIHCSVKGGGRAEAAAARAVAAADDEAHGAGEGAGQPGGAAAGVQAVAAKGPPAARLPAVCASSFSDSTSSQRPHTPDTGPAHLRKASDASAATGAPLAAHGPCTTSGCGNGEAGTLPPSPYALGQGLPSISPAQQPLAPQPSQPEQHTSTASTGLSSLPASDPAATASPDGGAPPPSSHPDPTTTSADHLAVAPSMGLDLDPGLLRGFPGLGLDPGEVDLQVGSRPATATGQTRSDNATDCGANAKVPSAPHSGSKVGGKPERPHVTLPGGASLQRCPSPSPKGPLTSLPPTPAPATPGLPATSSFGTEPSAAATGAVPVGTASAGPLGVRRGGPGAVSGGLGAHGFVTAASGQLATQPSAAGGSLVTLRSSESLGSILARHPGLVRAVRDPHPDAGLRPMRSILRQLGKKRLAQPRGRDMEWVFGLTGRAGTFVSMAPEVWSGLPYNEKADVFSFGIVMYELLARELLLISHFRTSLAAELRIQTPEDLAEAYTRGYRPARPRTLQGPSYDELWALITACWHDDPVQRPSMQEVAERLRQLRAQAADSAGLDGGPTDDAAATGANGAQQPRCAGCVVS